MITAVPHNYYTYAGTKSDCSFGNILFVIAGVIGVATKNKYAFGFYPWVNQSFFAYPIPVIAKTRQYKIYQLPINYKGFDIGFRGFNIPDNVQINGYFGSEKYFEHCKPLIRKYFTMRPLCPYKEDVIIVHCRNYETPNMTTLGRDYYVNAVKQFPKKPVVVITDDIVKARERIGEDWEYISNTPIIDFYLMTKAKYFVMANSTYSWWAAWLSQAETIAPKQWYASEFSDCPTDDLYCKGWTIL